MPQTLVNFFAIFETICNKNTTKYLMEDEMWVKLNWEQICYIFVYALAWLAVAAVCWALTLAPYRSKKGINLY